jgi:hypothetical protein
MATVVLGDAELLLPVRGYSSRVVAPGARLFIKIAWRRPAAAGGEGTEG